MTTKDLGYVLWRTPATVTYQFTNTGDKPLVISNVTTSCGCAKHNGQKNLYLPEERKDYGSV